MSQQHATDALPMPHRRILLIIMLKSSQRVNWLLVDCRPTIRWRSANSPPTVSQMSVIVSTIASANLLSNTSVGLDPLPGLDFFFHYNQSGTALKWEFIKTINSISYQFLLCKMFTIAQCFGSTDRQHYLQINNQQWSHSLQHFRASMAQKFISKTV